MDQRKLGGGAVNPIGLGCMGMSEFYGARDDAESVRVMRAAIERGVDHLDTADMYGVGDNERLVGEALRDGFRERVVLATKFGNVRGDKGEFLGIRGDAQYVKSCCEASLRRLGVERIDLYYQHRVDPAVPIEETVGAMAELVAEGKVRWLGLSEAGSATIRRAAAVHAIAALQSEYSLWSREVEDDELRTCRELGITFVAYSPLGRGFLAGAIKRPEDLATDDRRRMFPRFSAENFGKNLELVERVKAMAGRKGCTAGQLALAWVLWRGGDVVTIPGTKRMAYLEENLGAAGVTLTTAELAEIDAAFPVAVAAGERYPANGMAAVRR